MGKTASGYHPHPEYPLRLSGKASTDGKVDRTDTPYPYFVDRENPYRGHNMR